MRHLEFIRWGKSNGAIINQTKLVLYQEDSRGLHATINIKESKAIIKIPLEMCISYEFILSTDLGKALTSLNVFTPSLRPFIYPLLYILEEQNNDSFYKPWLDVLPKKIDHPLFYSKEECNYLKTSNALAKIELDKKTLTIFYNEIKDKFSLFTTKHSLQDFFFIYYMLGSRFFANLYEGRELPLLVPYADMANCSNPEEANASWDISENKEYFILRARIDIPKNSPVLIIHYHRSEYHTDIIQISVISHIMGLLLIRMSIMPLPFCYLMILIYQMLN